MANANDMREREGKGKWERDREKGRNVLFDLRVKVSQSLAMP